MIRIVTSLVLTGFLPLAVNAATISTSLEAMSNNPGGIIDNLAQDSFESLVQEGGVTAVDAQPPSSVGQAASSAYYSEFGQTLGVIATADNSASTAPNAHLALAALSFDETFTAIGSGTVTINLELAGQLGVVSDLQDRQSLAHAHGGYFLFAPGFFDEQIFTTAHFPDPLFTLDGGAFRSVLSSTFDIADGESFDLDILLSASAGQRGTLQQFFDADVAMTGFLSIEANGLTLETGGGNIPAPVPLPASAFFLVASLGALRAIRRGKSKN